MESVRLCLSAVVWPLKWGQVAIRWPKQKLLHLIAHAVYHSDELNCILNLFHDPLMTMVSKLCFTFRAFSVLL